MLRGSRDKSKGKKEVDLLMDLMKKYKESQVPYIQEMHELIDIDNVYLERLEGNFKNYGGLKYYKSFDVYLNDIVVPYFKEQKIKIGDLR
ncbi:hypothetical protein ACWTV9_10280 [Clostridioides difficile]|nr:hypothetical protein KW95_13985 [Clostridioides difficile]